MAICQACGRERQCDYSERKEWPELLGVDALEAKATIEKTNKLVEVILMPCYSLDASATMNCCCNRVLLWVTDMKNGKVCKVPVVG
ncbi:hypothetical protein J5N97_013821 [Dioscorea zingiberensis]|uniref:Uncharacterized protein n=1 Tax=Dioscorea zingiberensis TaxID=325984 RepID=A0A9D5HJG1_9LILI|nr:hypothetical protein J5N97_013821 [Dioscorea zingiberensis]